MTAYAPHWTSRVKIHYFVQGAGHTMQFRFPGPITGSGLTDALGAINNWLTALEDLLWTDWTVSAVTAADQDSTVFLPQTNPFTVTGNVATDNRQPIDKAFSVSFVARSSGGNPFKVSLYGCSPINGELDTEVNGRIRAGENADVDTAIDILQLAGAALIGNDALPLLWYDYANTKTNDRWLKKIRRGA